MKVAGFQNAAMIVMAVPLLAPPSLTQAVAARSESAPQILIDRDVVRVSSIALKFRPSPIPCGDQNRWFDRPTQVGSLVGGWVKDIRVIRYVPREGLSKEDEIRDLVGKVWQGEFQSASCYIMWAEGTPWSVAAVIEFADGKRATLVTDGSHVEVQDHEGRYWYMRLLPAAQ